MKRVYINKSSSGKLGSQQALYIAAIAFLFGGIFSACLVLNVRVASTHPMTGADLVANAVANAKTCPDSSSTASTALSSLGNDASTVHTALRDLKVFVVIVAFDFSQIPHLEEVLDSYHDLCASGSLVDVAIHATVPYPVTLIDMWNSRFTCSQFSLTIILKTKNLRLHLVDMHRPLFYEKINDYDLFIYTEDDIRVTPTTVATYLSEVRKVKATVATHQDYHFSDFNVGIVRYEYNYPANVVIDDKTRHATVNVTRVYWEHSGFNRPVVPNAVYEVPQKPLAADYVSMKNHHQGMYLATRELLLAWKDRKGCEFDQIKNRPGRGAQPTEGTQRVWMSSQQLYGNKHCNVQQLLPKEKFGSLTVLHLPNKNYRRVGKYRNRQFSDGSEVFEQPHESLLSAMELHLGVRQSFPQQPQIPYRGIRMIDEVGGHSPLLQRRMGEYQAYVNRGGVLSDYDMTKTELMEEV